MSGIKTFTATPVMQRNKPEPKNPTSSWNGKNIAIAIAALGAIGTIAYLYKANLDTGWFTKATTTTSQMQKLISEMPNKLFSSTQVEQLKTAQKYYTNQMRSTYFTSDQSKKCNDVLDRLLGDYSLLSSKSTEFLDQCKNKITTDCALFVSNSHLALKKVSVKTILETDSYCILADKISTDTGVNIIADLCKGYGLPTT